MNGRRFLTPATLTRVALPALAAALLLSGCGGTSSAGAGSTTSPSPTATASAKLSAFQTCLKQHGVTITPGEFERPARRVLLAGRVLLATPPPDRLPVRVAVPARDLHHLRR